MNNSSPLAAAYSIGVIIPMFNSGQLALNAINSIRDQRNVLVQEIVVVDDGSVDDSSDYLRGACSELKIPLRILSISNRGAAYARNYGINNCNCDLYAFLDSDDTWINCKLEYQIKLFNDPAVGMVGSYTTMGGNNQTNLLINDTPLIIRLRQQLFKNHFQTSTVIVRRRVLEEVGLFPEDQRYAEEGDLFNRIAAKYKCLLVPVVLVDYGNGKEGFGASGLSANLIAMEKGELRNILHVYQRGDCSCWLGSLAAFYSIVKFVRRVLISIIRRLTK